MHVCISTLGLLYAFSSECLSNICNQISECYTTSTPTDRSAVEWRVFQLSDVRGSSAHCSPNQLPVSGQRKVEWNICRGKNK